MTPPAPVAGPAMVCPAMVCPVMACPVCEGAHTHLLLSRDGRDYWACETCEARFLDPAQHPSIDDEHRHYHLHKNDPLDPAYRRFLAKLADPLIERLSPKSTGLDYGCGPGPALAEMLGQGGHTVALYDPLFAPDSTVLHETYDFITMSEVAEHLHAPHATFARLDGMLRPGGCLAVMTCFQTRDDAFADWHYRRDPTHVVFYREATLAHIARRFAWQLDVPCKDVAIMTKPDAGEMD